MTSTAQLLLNPGFEDASGGSLAGWQHGCMAQSVADAAPSSGSWSAEVEASNPQGCFWSSLYQPVSAYDGMTFLLGGWCRNVSGPWAPMIGFDIGIMDQGGAITLTGLGPTTYDTSWTWLSVNDTIHLAADEQAVVVCNPGLVGGPGYATARFDGIQFFETWPFSVPEQVRLSSHLDLASGQLSIASMSGGIHRVRVLDSIGREVLPAAYAKGNTTIRISISALAPGAYIAAAATDRGESGIRFVVP